MRGKKKLDVDSDSQSISPGGLIQNVGETNKHIGSQGKLSKKKIAHTHNYDPIENYLISVQEPSEHSCSINKIQQPKYEQNSKRSSRTLVEHQNLSSKGKCLWESRDLKRQLTNFQKKEKEKEKSCKLLFENNKILQGIVRKQKIQNLKKNFIKKIRRSSPCYQPVSLDRLDNPEKEGLLYMKGIEMKPLFQSIFNLLSVIQITSLLVIYSVSFVFEDLLGGDYPFVDMIQIFSLVFYWTEIILNFITVKFSAGKKIEIIKDIIDYYVGQTFWVDFISAVILLIDICSHQEVTSYFRMFIILKLPQCLDKIEKIQVYFIRNVYNQQYWEMAKVFLVNFCYAHVITLFLAAMANFSPSNNWLIVKGISSAPWLERYVWSYYWATNIMLTVGFGDLMAANYIEAICVIFIETFSCIIMAYNINRVGSIITNIRTEDMNRSKKFKIFRKLADQNNVSQELAFKINNYIEESSKIKKKFNYEEDQDFLKELPDNLRVTYLKEANKQILNKLVFFKSLLDRTLCNFSEHLQTKISHPQEIIRALDDDFNLIILRKGHIGYICKKNGCNFNESIVDQIKVRSKDSPFLTSLDFISKIRPQYQIKSLQFSVLFTLDYPKFIQIFRKSDMDYELFCFLRDKCRNIPDEFEVMPCQFCKTYNHFKFTCPRLHYVPYEQHVIDKEIYKENRGFNQRKQMYRHKPKSFKPMEYYKKVKGYREDMVKGRTRAVIAREQQTSYVFEATLKNINSFASEQPESGNRLRSVSTVENMFYDKAREVIEIQLLKKEKQENFNDEIWILNLDIMTNYNSYFPEANPKSVEERFSREARMASKRLRFNNKAMASLSQSEDEIDMMVEEYKIKAFTGSLGQEDRIEQIQ